MNRLYFAPASKNNPIDVPAKFQSLKTDLYEEPMEQWSPYVNFEATVRRPVCGKSIGLPLWYDAVPVWGITPNTAEGYWPPTKGDHVIFYTGSGRYPFIGRIDRVDVEKKLAADLWPHYPLAKNRGSDISNSVPWSHLIYFDVIWRADIPEQKIRALRNTTDDTLYRFTRVPENRHKRLSIPLGDWKGEVDNIVIYRRRETRRKLTKLMNQSCNDNRLLSVALRPTGINPQELAPHTRDNVLACLNTLY